jgi:N-acetylglucosaminyl-diphospho-decaprenol L-rhamnosyltransferase
VSLSIIIVSYNCRPDLERCLTSLAEHPPQVPHDIVVVDNASRDGTPDAVRSRWPTVRVIESGENMGFAKASNIGIRATRGDLVLLLNPDTIVPAGAIDALVAALDARPDVAVAGPRLVDECGRAELSFGRMLSPWVEARQKLLVRGSQRGIPPITALVEHMTARTRAVDWVSGACLLVRRHDLEAVGLLDERFLMYTEDVDLCAAVRARGRVVLFVAAAEIIHARGRSAASAPAATEAAYRRSQIAFYEKHRPRWVPVLKAYLTLRRQWPEATGRRSTSSNRID